MKAIVPAAAAGVLLPSPLNSSTWTSEPIHFG
jgi:hypothetical protein